MSNVILSRLAAELAGLPDRPPCPESDPGLTWESLTPAKGRGYGCGIEAPWTLDPPSRYKNKDVARMYQVVAALTGCWVTLDRRDPANQYQALCPVESPLTALKNFSDHFNHFVAHSEQHISDASGNHVGMTSEGVADALAAAVNRDLADPKTFRKLRAFLAVTPNLARVSREKHLYNVLTTGQVPHGLPHETHSKFAPGTASNQFLRATVAATAIMQEK